MLAVTPFNKQSFNKYLELGSVVSKILFILYSYLIILSPLLTKILMYMPLFIDLNRVKKSLCFVITCSLLLLINTQLLASENLEFQQNKNKIDSLNNTILKLLKTNSKEALENINRVLELNKLVNDSLTEAYYHHYLANYYRGKGNNNLAIEQDKTALEIFKIINHPKGTVSAMNELAILNKNIGNYSMTIDYLIEAIPIAREYKLKKLPDLLSNLALTHLLLGNNEEALKNLKRCLEEQPDSSESIHIIMNIGSIYKRQGDNNTAMSYYQKSLKLCVKYSLPRALMNDIQRNIASTHIELKQYNEALAYLYEIRENEIAENRKSDRIYTELNIASANKEKKHLTKAIKHAKIAVELAIETDYKPMLVEGYKLLSLLYEEDGKLANSLANLHLYTQLKDSLLNKESSKHINELNAKFESERKENEILLLKKEQEIKEERIAKEQQEVKSQTQKKWITIVIAFIIVVVAIIVVFFYNQKIRDNNLIAQKSTEVNNQKILELIRKHELKAIKENLNGREKERRRIAGELHDGIGGNLACLKMQLQKIIDDNKNQHELKELLNNVDNTYQEVRTISHNLSPIKITNSSFSQLIKEYTSNIENSSSYNINLQIFPEDKFNMLNDSIKIETYRILQELLHNITKHANANNVDIQFALAEDILNIMIEDDGIGFKSSPEKYSGLGLRSINSRIKSLSGTMNIDSALRRGTIINIDIPDINNVEMENV